MFDDAIDTSYKGNKNLKPRGTNISYSADQVKEYLKCSNDPIYFMKNYIKIVNLDKGLMLFDMFPFQEKMVKNLLNHRNTIFKLPRQSGKTTTTAAFAIHQAIFIDNYSILIAANKARTAIDIMKRIREAFQFLPKWLQQGVIKWNEGSVEFENGSRIVAVPTTSDAARGFSYNMIVLDEFAFLPKNIADEFFTSVIPTISSGETTKIAILSTPKGMNHFYKLWTETEKKQTNFKPLEIKWNDVPGRDAAFKKRMLESFGGDVTRWLQEFEADFIGTSNTLISPTTIKNLVFDKPIGQTQVGVTIYEQPIPDHTYFMCVDTAEGKGLDYHAFTVMDITSIPFNVVARFRNNVLSELLLPDIIYQMAKIYNEAFVLIETRSLGASVSGQLFYELEYPNILAAEPRGRNGLVLTNFRDKNRGLSTSAQSRAIGCSRMKVLVESGQLLFKDFEIIEELSNFVLIRDKFQADEGYHDDLVMTMIMFSWASSTAFFKELTNVNIKDVFHDKLKEIQDNLVPFGFIVGSADDFGNDIPDF